MWFCKQLPKAMNKKEFQLRCGKAYRGRRRSPRVGDGRTAILSTNLDFHSPRKIGATQAWTEKAADLVAVFAPATITRAYLVLRKQLA